jgi:hypothetical protein
LPTVRKETALRIRELARNRGLAVDELMNEPMGTPSKGVWSTCTMCGVRVKACNIERHVAQCIRRPLGEEK